jgi:hypothetical protein
MLFVLDHYDEACNKAELLYNKIKKEYSIENIANKHIELYRSLL